MNSSSDLLLNVLEVFFNEQMIARRSFLNQICKIPYSKKGSEKIKELLIKNPFINAQHINRACTIYSTPCIVRLPDNDQFAVVVLTAQVQQYEKSLRVTKKATLLPCLITNKFIENLSFSNNWTYADFDKFFEALVESATYSILLSNMDTLADIRQLKSSLLPIQKNIRPFNKNCIVIPICPDAEFTTLAQGELLEVCVKTKVYKLFVLQSSSSFKRFKNPDLAATISDFFSKYSMFVAQNAFNISVAEYLEKIDKSYAARSLRCFFAYKKLYVSLQNELSLTAKRNFLPKTQVTQLANRFLIYQAFHKKAFEF